VIPLKFILIPKTAFAKQSADGKVISSYVKIRSAEDFTKKGFKLSSDIESSANYPFVLERNGERFSRTINGVANGKTIISQWGNGRLNYFTITDSATNKLIAKKGSLDLTDYYDNGVKKFGGISHGWMYEYKPDGSRLSCLPEDGSTDALRIKGEIATRIAQVKEILLSTLGGK